MDSIPNEIWVIIINFLGNHGINLFVTNKFFLSLITLSKCQLNVVNNIFKKGYLDVIKYVNFLKSIKNTIAMDQTKFGKITLNQALKKSCKHGHLDVVKYLVILGANVRFCNNNSIQLASKYGYLEIVKYLIDCGSDFRSDYNAAFRLASEFGRIEVVKYLVAKGTKINAEKNYAFRKACRNGHINIVKFLINHGADIKSDNNYALRKASKYGHLDIVKILVEKGADVKTDNNYAIRKAYSNKHYDISDFLFEHGADRNSIDGYFSKIQFIPPVNFLSFGSYVMPPLDNREFLKIPLDNHPDNGKLKNLLKEMNKKMLLESNKLFKEKTNKYKYHPIGETTKKLS